MGWYLALAGSYSAPPPFSFDAPALWTLTSPEALVTFGLSLSEATLGFLAALGAEKQKQTQLKWA